MKKITSSLVGLMALTALILPGCKGKDASAAAQEEMHISASAPIIMSINFNQIIENAGGQASRGKYEAGATLTKLAGRDNDDFKKFFDEYLPLVDAANVFMTVMDEQSFFMTAPIADLAGLEKKIKEAGLEKSEADGFTVYAADTNEGYLLIRDSQLWFTINPEVVYNDYKEAKTNSIASHKELAGLFNGHTMSIILDTEFYNSMMAQTGVEVPEALTGAGKYGVGYFDLKGLKATGHFEAWDADYKLVTTATEGGFGIIEASELRFLPAATKMAMAIGKPSQEFISYIMKEAGLGSDISTMASMVLDGLNGSIVIGADMPASLAEMSDPAAWHITLAVGYDEETANQLLGMTQMFGAQKSGDGYVFPINQPGINCTLHFGYYDGMIVASTGEIEKGSAPAITKPFAGNQAAIAISLPAGNPIMSMAGIKWGVDFVAYGNTTGDSTLELTGTDGLLLENILKVVAAHI